MARSFVGQSQGSPQLGQVAPEAAGSCDAQGGQRRGPVVWLLLLLVHENGTCNKWRCEPISVCRRASWPGRRVGLKCVWCRLLTVGGPSALSLCDWPSRWTQHSFSRLEGSLPIAPRRLLDVERKSCGCFYWSRPRLWM